MFILGYYTLGWLARRIHRKSILKLKAVRAVCSIIGTALLGVACSILSEHIARGLCVLCTLGGVFCLWSLRGGAELKKFAITRLIWMLLAYTIFLAAVPLPVKQLPDGPYVTKQWQLAGKIQYILDDMPSDNMVPYIVSEYLLNKINLRENSEIIPGQQITDRGVGTSLITVPSILISGKSNIDYYQTDNLPLYEYYGLRPDFMRLFNHGNFNIFMGAYCAVQLWLLFFACEETERLFGGGKATLFIALLATNFYVITQSVFSWPKIITGYLLLLAVLMLRDTELSFYQKAACAALFSGVSPHFHPLGYWTIAAAVIGTLII